MGKLDEALRDLNKSKTRSGNTMITEFGELLLCLRDDMSGEIDKIKTNMHKIECEQVAQKELHEKNMNTLTQIMQTQSTQIHKLETTVENLQKNMKKNTIIIKGIDPRDCETHQARKNTVNNILMKKLNMKEFNIEECTAIKIGNQSGIQITFGASSQKFQMFKNIKKLEGSGITIENWLTPHERQVKNQLLMKRRQLINEGETCWLQKNKFLIVENKRTGLKTKYTSDGKTIFTANENNI